MKNRILIILGLMVSFGAGWAAALMNEPLAPQLNTNWQQLSSKSEGPDVGLTRDALFKSDIRWPGVKSMHGSAKYLHDHSNATASPRLGYKITVDVEGLDKKTLPEKYTKEKKVYGGKFTLMPIEQVSYEMNFTFVFRDVDGFELLTLTSEPDNIQSGAVETFQGIVPTNVPLEVTRNASTISLGMTLTKCGTCE